MCKPDTGSKKGTPQDTCPPTPRRRDDRKNRIARQGGDPLQPTNVKLEVEGSSRAQAQAPPRQFVRYDLTRACTTRECSKEACVGQHCPTFHNWLPKHLLHVMYGISHVHKRT